MLLCRSDRPIPADARRKIALFCNIREERVIPAIDVDTTYATPLTYNAEGFDTEVLKHFGLDYETKPDLSVWRDIVERVREPEGTVRIGVVGKYTDLKDAYKSLIEALNHGGIANNVKVECVWIEAEAFEKAGDNSQLEDVHGILVPGGFGERGAEGKILAAKFARKEKLPYFGICFGMQMAVIEMARSVVGWEDAGSTEFGPTMRPVVGLMTEWKRGNEVEQRDNESDLGGTMRLGAYPAALQDGTRVAEVYGESLVHERHRHRYEINIAYREEIEAAGMIFSGLSPDGRLPEIVELPDHPWFIGVQFHPELKSRPMAPHPLFKSFIAAALDQARLV
jgi:CTP synthase